MSKEAGATGAQNKSQATLEEIYKQHKGSIRNRYDKNGTKIEFKLTFKEWSDIWTQSGHLHERGRSKGSYCMSRYNDIGHYEVGNVIIQLTSDNTYQHNKDYVHSDETRQKIKLARSKQLPNRIGQKHKDSYFEKIKAQVGKNFITPFGIFKSKTEATKQLSLSYWKLTTLTEKFPKEYYYG